MGLCELLEFEEGMDKEVFSTFGTLGGMGGWGSKWSSD